ADWHNAFSDFTIRLSQRLHDLPDRDKLALMQSLQSKLSELGAEKSPPPVPSPVTPIETQAFDEEALCLAGPQAPRRQEAQDKERDQHGEGHPHPETLRHGANERRSAKIDELVDQRHSGDILARWPVTQAGGSREGQRIEDADAGPDREKA